MTALSIRQIPFLNWTRRSVPARTETTAPVHDPQRRDFACQLIAAGACDSEFGVQMLMSVYPDRF